MLERDFQAKVLELAKLTGWFVYHTFDSRRSEPGFPDLVLVHPRQGRVLFRELKTDTGQLSLHQVKWLQALKDAGADAEVWRPVQWPGIVKTLKAPAVRAF